MSPAEVGILYYLLVLTLMPKLDAQDSPVLEQLHGSSHLHKNSYTKHLIANRFGKPVQMKSPRSIHKCHSVKGSCQLKVYNVFSKDNTSSELRSNYGIWNYGNFRDVRGDRVQRLFKRNEINAKAKALYTKLIDEKENPYVMDDDYSLMNYVDNWKGVDRKVKMFHNSLPKPVKILKPRKHHQKRDLEDKEFQVAFHSSRKDEIKRKIQTSYEPVEENNHRKMSRHYRSKKRRNYGYFDPEVDRYRSRSKFASNKKHTLWGRKRAKVYPKLGANSGFLDEIERRSRPLVGKGHGWNWATARDYMAAVTPREEFGTPQEQKMVPRVLIPGVNPSVALIPQSFPERINGYEDFQTTDSFEKLPQDLSNTMNRIPFSNVAFKPVLNQHSAHTGKPTVLFNPLTEAGKRHENCYEQFPNTQFWNVGAGPPQLVGVMSNPVSFSDAQKPKMIPSVMTRTFENIGSDRFKIMPSLDHTVDVPPVGQCSSQGIISAQHTPKALETADIVNLLKNAFLPQNTLDPSQFATTSAAPLHALMPQSIPIDQVLGFISPSGSMWMPTNADSDEDSTTDKNLIVDATKQTLLSLFTTEGPLMESLEDILRRNTDRKIPIVYDIEDVPQLSLQNPNPSVKNNSQPALTPLHVLDRRGISKKNKSAVKSKIVSKTDTTSTHKTTPWIVLSTTENMLYSEMMEMERRKLNTTRKSKTRISAARSKIQTFKNKMRSNDTDKIQQQELPTQVQNEGQQSEEPKVKTKRDEKAAGRRKTYLKPATSEPGCGKCTRACHPTVRRAGNTCGKVRPPLELTTKMSCQPKSLSKGSISCPYCQQEFTYKLGLRLLNV